MLVPSGGLVGVFKVAVDESAKNGLVCVAGVVSTPAEWEAFSTAWRPTADTYEHGFHATKGRYTDNALLADLVSKLHTGCAMVITSDDFRVVTAELRSVYGSVYTHALRALIQRYQQWCVATGTEWVAWVLEAGDKSARAARTVLDDLVGDPDFHIYSHNWVGKGELITHAADLVAYLATAGEGTYSPLLRTIEPRIEFVRADGAQLREMVRDGERLLKKFRGLKARERRRRKIKGEI